ncbi:NAD(P)-binding protein [Lepidopterella palustris CBS 459.81]|uniref:NAD(P)-binding protein n=1 Tax=Lepidopterella palustris CBS 459.81 TaxID=1314670 RepID=A0A8E2E3V9_9PEZI|nr:NAD(P)-binding protein [Lepidopterella palustris CBS 459.81]
MAPTRIGIIGLSPTAISSWASTAHLPYLRDSPYYKITALCNSSISSAENAIKHYKLPASTKSYDDPAKLAADPSVDLIVVAVAVKSHAKLVRPVLHARKDVFCEWPLGVNAAEARELAQLAKEKGVKTYVGTQSRVSPTVVKVRQLIKNGIIGKVTSTDATATFGPPMDIWMASATSYLEMRSGGNPLSIRFAHFIDGFCYTLGEFLPGYHSLLAVGAKEIKVYDMKMSEFAEIAQDPESRPYKLVSRTSPDEILLQGTLEGGAVASVHFRTGAADPDGSLMRWTITGTEGLIQVTQTGGINYNQDRTARVRIVKGKAEDVELDWGEEEWKCYGKNIDMQANTGRLWKAIAEGMTGYMDFEGAVRRHELIDGMIDQHDAKGK